VGRLTVLALVFVSVCWCPAAAVGRRAAPKAISARRRKPLARGAPSARRRSCPRASRRSRRTSSRTRSSRRKAQRTWSRALQRRCQGSARRVREELKGAGFDILSTSSRITIPRSRGKARAEPVRSRCARSAARRTRRTSHHEPGRLEKQKQGRPMEPPLLRLVDSLPWMHV